MNMLLIRLPETDRLRLCFQHSSDSKNLHAVSITVLSDDQVTPTQAALVWHEA